MHILITGWEQGLQKVSLTKLLMNHSQMSLKNAKTSVDKLLDGQQVKVQVSSLEEAENIVIAARKIGAICKIVGT